MKRPAKRPWLFSDQNIRGEEEELPSLGIDPSFFEKPKSLEVVVHLNFSSGRRVKEINNSNTRSIIKNNNTAKRNNNHNQSHVGKVFHYYAALVYNGFPETSGKNSHYIFSRQERFYC